MNEPIKRAPRATTEDLQELATQGVQRALAARREMTELTPEQTLAVSGAATLATTAFSPVLLKPGPIIYGLWNPEILTKNTLDVPIAQIAVR